MDNGGQFLRALKPVLWPPWPGTAPRSGRTWGPGPRPGRSRVARECPRLLGIWRTLPLNGRWPWPPGTPHAQRVNVTPDVGPAAEHPLGAHVLKRAELPPAPGGAGPWNHHAMPKSEDERRRAGLEQDVVRLEIPGWITPFLSAYCMATATWRRMRATRPPAGPRRGAVASVPPRTYAMVNRRTRRPHRPCGWGTMCVWAFGDRRASGETRAALRILATQRRT